jgi:hypothetical protein
LRTSRTICLSPRRPFPRFLSLADHSIHLLRPRRRYLFSASALPTSRLDRWPTSSKIVGAVPETLSRVISITGIWLSLLAIGYNVPLQASKETNCRLPVALVPPSLLHLAFGPRKETKRHCLDGAASTSSPATSSPIYRPRTHHSARNGPPLTPPSRSGCIPTYPFNLSLHLAAVLPSRQR